MYSVSQRYRDGMKQDLRERSYIRVNFGIVNQEAQSSAVVDWANTSTAQTYSDSDDLFKNGNNDVDYATFEQDFVKVDGSQIFYKDNNDVNKYISSAFVTEQNPVKVTINLNVEEAQEIKGLTVSFGDLYPTKFDVINVTTGKTLISVTDNTSSTWISEEVLSDIKSIRFVFYKMKSSPTRLRINYILFGLGKTYTNDNIVESTLEESLSPINENLPQYDFSVQLDNYPDENGVRYFDVDNPSSTINYLKKGQEIDVFYGYELPTVSEDDEDTVEELSEDTTTGEIEWVKGGHFYISEWESNDTTATIKATDILRDKEDIYDKGVYNPSGTTYYDLCVSVLANMGITNYELSDVLKEFKTTTPIPKVTHKEVLQLIANACGCEIVVDRDGKVIMKLGTNDGNSYWRLASTENVTKSGTEYISNISSDSQGVMISPPTFKYTFYKQVNFVEEQIRYYNKIVIKIVEFQFGDNLPSEIRITSSSGINIVVTENIETNMRVSLDNNFTEIGDLTITFPKMREAGVKLSIKKINPTDISDFAMEKINISENMAVTKLNTTQKVVINFSQYVRSTTAEVIATSTYDFSIDDSTYVIETFNFDKPYANYYAKVVYRSTNSEGEEVDKETVYRTPTITKQGAYFVEVKYKKGDGCNGTNTLKVYGYTLNRNDYSHYVTYNDNGDIINWENPLINNRRHAQIMASFIGNYYRNTMEYSYSTRGNPELDVGDKIYQENDYHPNITTRITNYSTEFNGSFSGSVTARRW